MTELNAAKFVSDNIGDVSNDSSDPLTVNKRAGDTIFATGDKGKFMYVIQQGTVDIVVNDVRLERVTAGGIVGEMA